MIFRHLAGNLPGLLLCLLIGFLAVGMNKLVGMGTGSFTLDPFTGAILLGMSARFFLKIDPVFTPGIRCGSITVLEIAVLLLGFSLDFSVFEGGNFVFVGAVFALVCLMIVISFTICRAVGLPEHLAVLVACGNSICGNAAIAAVAPAVRARNEDVVAAITFSSILGVLFVLGLPFLAPAIGLNAFQFGTFAGLTVYAVPQVVAATAPVSLVSAQVGTAVKLVRVLMLVPAVLFAPLLLRNRETPDGQDQKPKFRLARVLPWFIPGFIIASALNKLGFVPENIAELSSGLSRYLFIFAMAGLGLSVDLRKIRKIGPELVISITLCLAILSLASFLFVKSLA